MTSDPITSWQIRWGNNENSEILYFAGLQNHCRWWLSHENKRCLLLGGKVMTNLDSILKSRDITLQTNVCLVKAVVFPVVRYGCESWTIKKVEHRKIDAFELWCWRRLLRAPWTQGDQSWIFVGRTDAEAETPILWPPDAKNWLIWKDPDAGKDWRQEETEDDRGQQRQRTTEDEMAEWHHQLNGHEFGWTPGVGDRQGGLACWGSWGLKELNTTEWLNWTYRETNQLLDY